MLIALFVTTKHETQTKKLEEQNKKETIVIESLELITASKHVFILRRFVLFNCGLRGDVFGTLAMYSRTTVQLVNNTLGKKGSLDYKARYYARIFPWDWR